MGCDGVLMVLSERHDMVVRKTTLAHPCISRVGIISCCLQNVDNLTAGILVFL